MLLSTFLFNANLYVGEAFMSVLLRWLSSLILVGFLAACTSGTDYGNLGEVAQKNGFTALLAAAEKAGISSTLTAPDANLTVFSHKHRRGDYRCGVGHCAGCNE